MAIRECLVPDRRKEMQEEVVADLHTCLEQLNLRSCEMENKIENCTQKAMHHMRLSKRDPTTTGQAREKARAKMYIEDRRRVQVEYEKVLKSTHMLQQQIDSIVSAHVDMVIVDAMRQFNVNASKLALPARAMEIEHLGEELAERYSETMNLQEAIQGVSSNCNVSSSDSIKMDDESLWNELELYMNAMDEREVSKTVTKNNDDQISLMQSEPQSKLLDETPKKMDQQSQKDQILVTKVISDSNSEREKINDEQDINFYNKRELVFEFAS